MQGQTRAARPRKGISSDGVPHDGLTVNFPAFAAGRPASANSRSGKMAGSRLLAAKATMCILLSKSMPSASVMRALGRMLAMASVREGRPRLPAVGAPTLGSSLRLARIVRALVDRYSLPSTRGSPLPRAYVGSGDGPRARTARQSWHNRFSGPADGNAASQRKHHRVVDGGSGSGIPVICTTSFHLARDRHKPPWGHVFPG